jgi:hypothetical protein
MFIDICMYHVHVKSVLDMCRTILSPNAISQRRRRRSRRRLRLDSDRAQAQALSTIDLSYHPGILSCFCFVFDFLCWRHPQFKESYGFVHYGLISKQHLMMDVLEYAGVTDISRDAAESCLPRKRRTIGKRFPLSSHQILTVEQNCSSGCKLRWD